MPPSRTADLHLHTRFSDGTDTPQRVVELAKAAGLSAMALTDHDNVDAIAIAAPAAQQHGVELIPGVEMSASAGDEDVHLLGFYLDVEHPGLRQHLAEQQARRVQRVHEMVRRLQQAGVRIEADEVFATAGKGTVGRPHLARVLLRRGYVTTMAEAFQKYLGPDNPGFVPGSPLMPRQVIQVIRASGGVPVLAHPIHLKRDELIEQLVKDGLAGIEAYHADHDPAAVRRYELMADRLGLVKTGGSDYHGTSKEGRPVGTSRVPYALVEALRQSKAALAR